MKPRTLLFVTAVAAGLAGGCASYYKVTDPHTQQVYYTDQLSRQQSGVVVFKDAKTSRDQTVDGDHGRIETRTTTVIHDVDWLQDRHDWPGLKAVVIVDSIREIGDRIERETRCYITSLVLLASLLGPIVRGHWSVENSLHWVMDMNFRDDECRIRTDNAPANFTTLKHMAHNLIQKAPGKDSLRLRRKVAAWDDDFLASLVAA